MLYRKPALLTERHGVGDFRSGEPALDAFLKETALYNQQQNYARTVVIADTDGNIVGYYALCAGMVSRSQAPRSVKGGRAPTEIPVALLGRLAVDERHQGRGLGGTLLRHALLAVVSSAHNVAFRAVMVHPISDEAARFYRKYGFVEARGTTGTLLLSSRNIVAAVKKAAGPN